MGTLSNELRDLGYERTERESPFDDDGELWTNSFELVCDETGSVIRKDSSDKGGHLTESDDGETVYRYRNTENVKLYGGYVSSYNWGNEDGIFSYD